MSVVLSVDEQVSILWNELVSFLEMWHPNGDNGMHIINQKDFCYLTYCTCDFFCDEIMGAFIDKIKPEVEYINYEDGVLYVKAKENYQIRHLAPVTIISD